jgi:hypothetical protein
MLTSVAQRTTFKARFTAVTPVPQSETRMPTPDADKASPWGLFLTALLRALSTPAA